MNATAHGHVQRHELANVSPALGILPRTTLLSLTFIIYYALIFILLDLNSPVSRFCTLSASEYARERPRQPCRLPGPPTARQHVSPRIKISLLNAVLNGTLGDVRLPPFIVPARRLISGRGNL